MSGETVADRRVHPATVLLRFLREAPSTVIALPAGIAIVSKGDWSRALIVAAVAAAVFLFFNWLAWTRFRYGVGEREIVIESGIISRNRRSIPFNRIQDVDIERALLARLFGLAKVRIETGAGGKDEGLLDSVTMAEAARLRAAVRAWREGHAPEAEAAADGAVPAAPEGRLLFAMPVPRVLVFGLFNFSLVYIASFFAFLQTFDNLLPFDIYEPAQWFGLVGDRLPQRFTPAAIAAVLFLAALLGVVAGVLRTLARDFSFRLSVEGSRLRRERGLFTRTEAVIAKKRVQLGHVATGPVRRLFGWSGLSLQTLGSGADGSGMQAAAPFATQAELEPVLAELPPLRLVAPAELTMVSSRHVLRVLASSLVPALVVIGAAAAAWRPALLLVALLPLLGGAAALQRRFHRYALDGELLFVVRGVWRQQLWVIPLARTQAISVARGLVQRRLGLATLSIDTAGASIMNAPRIVDLSVETAWALAAEIAARRGSQASGRKSGTER